MEIASYTDTAYDSRHPRALGPQTHDIGIAERQIRRYPIKSRGVHCREYLAISRGVSLLIERLNALTPTKLREMENEYHHVDLDMTWGTWKNPLVVVDAITKLAGAFSLAAILTALISLYASGSIWLTTKAMAPFLVPLFSIYFLGKTIQKRGWVSNKNNTVLNRCTGMVSFIHKKKRIALPFDEFDPYLSPATDPTGGTHYYLRLIHRYSAAFVTELRAYIETWEVEQAWERVQQFMDISQPLPDIPELELTRAYDPTTLAYDRDHHRGAEYWRRQRPDDVVKMKEAARKAAQRYPWGKPRALALAEGWQPSGLGEGDWRGKPRPATPRQAKG